MLTAAVFLAVLTCLLARGGLPPLHSTASAIQLWWHGLAGSTPQPARGPALHGPVKKLGMINMTYFYPPMGQNCKAERLWWYDAAAGRGNLTQADLARLRKGPCMQCQVYVVSWRLCVCPLGMERGLLTV